MSGPSEKKQLGKILLKQRLVSAGELEQILQRQRSQPGQRLASVLHETGKVAEVDLLKALSEQQGCPGVDLSQVVIPLEHLELVPEDVARQHQILPVLVKESQLALAMADPSERRVLEEIEFVTGREVIAYVALHAPLSAAIDACYLGLKAGETHFVGSQVEDAYLVRLGLDPKKFPRRERPKAKDVDKMSVLPVAKAEIPAAEAAAPPPRPPRKPGPTRILIVDDEEDIRRLLDRVLSQKGFETAQAETGTEALEKVPTFEPDLLVLDAMLPGVHGFDICRRLKASEHYAHIPIVMVSAIYRGWRVAEDLKASYGVEAFLEKPFKIGDVLRHVEVALERSTEIDLGDEGVSAEAAGLLQRGLSLFQDGDHEGAVAALKEGLTIDPVSFELHYHLGLLYGRADSLFEAIQELETAVNLSPRNFSALKNLAVLYQRAGFRHKAIEMWERALGGAPDDETRQGIKEHLMSLL